MQGPRLYRFFNYEQMLYLPAPTGGWNPDANAWEMPLEQAPVLDNFLVRQGKVIMRGPVNTLVDLSTIPGASVSPLNCCGIVCGHDGVQIATRASGLTDAWRIPYMRWSSTPTVVSTTGLFFKSTSPATKSTITYTRDNAPGFRWIEFDGLLYGISADSSSAVVSDVNATYSIPPVNLLTLDPTFFTAVAPTVLTNAPHGAVDLKGYQSRVWLLGGVDTPGAGTTHSSVTLFFTNPGESGIGTNSSDWKNPVSGLTNKITMDQDTSDPAVGLATVRNGMLVFRKHSVWLLRGTTTNNYNLVPVSREVGCIDARSIVEADAGVYFLSRRGLMLTDGVRVTNVSGSAQRTLTSAISATDGVLPQWSPAFQCRMLHGGQLLVSIASTNLSNTPSLQPVWCGVYDPSVRGGAWSRFTSSVFNGDSGVNPANQNYPGLLCGYTPTWQVFSVGDRYAVALEFPTNFLSALGSGISLAEDMDGSAAGLYDNCLTAGAFAMKPIPAVWQTRLVPTVGNASRTRKYAIGKRYVVDYLMQSYLGVSAPSQPPGWTVTPIDATAAALSTAMVTDNLNPGSLFIAPDQTGINTSTTNPIAGSALGVTKMIQRKNQDFTVEHGDMCFLVRFLDGSPPVNPFVPRAVRAELYGIGYESQPTRELR